MRRLFLAAAASALTALSGANALTITITGTPGDGVIDVALSGSATVQSGEATFISLIGSDDGSWFSFGDAVTDALDNQGFLATVSDAVLTVEGTAYDLAGLYLDDDGDDLDDVGLYTASGEDAFFEAGDLIELSGNMTVPVDFALLIEGIYQTGDFGFGRAVLPATLVIGDAVPVPAALPLFGAGLAGLGLARRRAQQRA